MTRVPVTFKYDPFGRRIQKVFTQGSTTTTSNYVYDGDNSVQDVDQNGNLLARYAEGTSIDEPLAQSRSGVTSYFDADGLGSVTSLSSSSGSLVNSYTYDSFGRLTASSGSITNRFQYTGREFDSETGLQFSRARYLDPMTGRFISEDPIGFSGGANFYGYVLNSPIGFIDPTGTQCCTSPGDSKEPWNDYKSVGNMFALYTADNFAGEALRGSREWARQRNLPAGSNHNGAADAFRHCFWSCNMTRYLGEIAAEAIGDEHEKAGNRHNQPPDEEKMDRANNMMGRNAALNCPKNDKSCWDLCTELYNQGRLFGLSGRQNYFPQDGR